MMPGTNSKTIGGANAAQPTCLPAARRACRENQPVAVVP